MEIKKQTRLRGELTVPGDKSISHRAVMFGSLAQGTTRITHFLEGADCLSTISCFRKMGVGIERNASEILVHGKGLHGLSAPSEILDVGNSGTTTRLISGILAGQSFTSQLNGDASIQSRPMKRIMTPLQSMGRYCQYQREWMRTFAYYRKASPGCTLPVTGCFCSGEVLCTSGRYVCRWDHQCDRTGTFQKSHGDHVELSGGQSYLTGYYRLH